MTSLEFDQISVIIDEHPLLGNDQRIKNKFQNSFELAQKNFNPYFFIAIENTKDKKFKVTNTIRVIEYVDLLNKVEYLAYRCFDFTNFKEGKEPKKTSFATEKLERFITDNSSFLVQNEQMLLAATLSDEPQELIRKAQWITANFYYSGQGVRKDFDEAVKWAWCATHGPGKIGQASAMIALYYHALKMNGSETKALSAITKIWLNKAKQDGFDAGTFSNEIDSEDDTV